MLLKRDMRFVPERHKISRSGVLRLAVVCTVSVASLYGLAIAAREAWRAVSETETSQLIIMEPDRKDWKRRPEAPGGREFVNQGLEINRVQAELFEQPNRDEIVLAPPPSDF